MGKTETVKVFRLATAKRIPVLRRHSPSKGEHPLRRRVCICGFVFLRGFVWVVPWLASRAESSLTCAILLPTQFADGEVEEALPFVEEVSFPSPWGGCASVGAMAGWRGAFELKVCTFWLDLKKGAC